MFSVDSLLLVKYVLKRVSFGSKDCTILDVVALYVVCYVVHYFITIPSLQSSWWGRESWLLCFVYLP